MSFLYDYEEKIRTGFNKRYRFTEDGNTDTLLQDFDIKSGEQEVLWGTFGSGFLELNPDNFLNLTTMFSRVSSDTTISQLGFREDTGFEDRFATTKNSYNFIGRSIFFNQLTGDHRNLGQTAARLQWTVAGGLGRRDEPDRREIQQFPESQLVTTPRATTPTSISSSSRVKSSVRFPLYQAFEGTAYGSVGFLGLYQPRDFTARRFVQQQLGGSQLIGDPETLFNESQHGSRHHHSRDHADRGQLRGQQPSACGICAARNPHCPLVDSSSGFVRFEGFTQQVRSDSPFAEATDPNDIKETNRTDLNPLPSATFRFQANEKMFVILGYGMTAIRPAIRELAPFTYVDFIRGWNVSGNPDLESTVVQNAEARYEYLLRRNRPLRGDRLLQVLRSSRSSSSS